MKYCSRRVVFTMHNIMEIDEEKKSGYPVQKSCVNPMLKRIALVRASVFVVLIKRNQE